MHTIHGGIMTTVLFTAVTFTAWHPWPAWGAAYPGGEGPPAAADPVILPGNGLVADAGEVTGPRPTRAPAPYQPLLAQSTSAGLQARPTSPGAQQGKGADEAQLKAIVTRLYESGDFENSYFTQKLGKFLARQEQATPDDPNFDCLNFDILYGGQDNEITKLAIMAPQVTGDRGKVIVKFHNFGFSQKRVVDFVREAGQWKIADISDEVESLRRTMQECK